MSRSVGEETDAGDSDNRDPSAFMKVDLKEMKYMSVWDTVINTAMNIQKRYHMEGYLTC